MDNFKKAVLNSTIQQSTNVTKSDTPKNTSQAQNIQSNSQLTTQLDIERSHKKKK